MARRTSRTGRGGRRPPGLCLSGPPADSELTPRVATSALFRRGHATYRRGAGHGSGPLGGRRGAAPGTAIAERSVGPQEYRDEARARTLSLRYLVDSPRGCRRPSTSRPIVPGLVALLSPPFTSQAPWAPLPHRDASSSSGPGGTSVALAPRQVPRLTRVAGPS